LASGKRAQCARQILSWLNGHCAAVQTPLSLSRKIERKIQCGRIFTEEFKPVLFLFLRFRRPAELRLPLHKILVSRRRSIEILPVVQPAKIGRQHVDGHAVADDVMQVEEKDVIGLTHASKAGPKQRCAPEIEPANKGTIQFFDALLPIHLAEVHLNLHLVRDHLNNFIANDRK